MAWDLSVYGIAWEVLQASSPIVQTPQDMFVWLDDSYEKYQKHFSETPISQFIPELFTFRSKQICFAIQQLVHLFDEQFALQIFEKSFTKKDACYIMSKPEILAVLDWLHTFAVCLSEENIYFNSSEYVGFVEKEIAENRSYKQKNQEFEHFANYVSIFESWKKKINNAHYTYFYWENSF